MDAIEAGRQAWARINQATTFEAWKSVAIAIALGRQQALRQAGVNRPYGHKYAAAINQWLCDNGFVGMPYGLRTALCIVADNLTPIETWLAEQPDQRRANLNNPQVIVRNFRRSQNQTPPHVADAKAAPAGDLFEAILAAVESRWHSEDLHVIARAAWVAAKMHYEPTRAPAHRRRPPATRRPAVQVPAAMHAAA
jgi:hypothetical protein